MSMWLYLSVLYMCKHCIVWYKSMYINLNGHPSDECSMWTLFLTDVLFVCFTCWIAPRTACSHFATRFLSPLSNFNRTNIVFSKFLFTPFSMIYLHWMNLWTDWNVKYKQFSLLGQGYLYIFFQYLWDLPPYTFKKIVHIIYWLKLELTHL